jgi:hypothetical protein
VGWLSSVEVLDMTDEEEGLDLEETEAVVLTRWEKIKQWFEIAKAGFTIGKILWGLIIVGGGAVVVGEATDTKPIRDVAVSVGLLDETVPVNSGAEPYIVELRSMQGEITRLTEQVQELEAHQHKPLSVPHSHDLAKHTHAYAALNHEHPAAVAVLPVHDHEPTTHTHADSAGSVGKAQIDDAFERHIKFDH